MTIEERLADALGDFVKATVDLRNDPCTEYYRRRDRAAEDLVKALRVLIARKGPV